MGWDSYRWMSFESWYVGYRPQLIGALIVVSGDADAAVDAADEAMVRALARWDRISAAGSPEAWTYTVGVNVLRRRSRRLSIERKILRRPEPQPPAQLQTEVWQAVKALPRRQREAIALRYLLDLSEAGVAEAMGVAIGTASATLASARARLAELLETDVMIEVDQP